VPKQIQTPSIGQALVRAFGLKGRFQPVLDETIVPVVVVPLDVPATKRLAAWGATGGAAGVGNQNAGFFLNPATSGHIVVLTRFWGTSGVLGDVCEFAPVAGAAGVSAIGRWRDLQLTGQPVARTGLVAVATGVLGFPGYPLNGTPTEVQYVLPPNWHLIIRQQAANTTLTLDWEWYEVPLRGDTTL
jgi:hypothetical protein